MKLLLLAASLLFAPKMTPETAAVGPNASSLPSSTVAALLSGALIAHLSLDKKKKGIPPTAPIKRDNWSKKYGPRIGLFATLPLLLIPIFATRIGSHLDQTKQMEYSELFTKTVLGILMYCPYGYVYDKACSRRTLYKSRRWSMLFGSTLGMTALAVGCYLTGI